MKLAGFLLLLAGWGLVLSSLALLPPGAEQNGFVLAAVLIELLGLALTVRSHQVPRNLRG